MEVAGKEIAVKKYVVKLSAEERERQRDLGGVEDEHQQYRSLEDNSSRKDSRPR